MDPQASSTSTSQCDVYSSLPSLVSAVGNRIGLDRSCDGRPSRGNVDKLIRDSAPQFDSQGMKFKFYFLDDIHPIFKKRCRENNNGQRLNSIERRKLFTIDKNSKLEYKTFEKINCLWNQYMSNIIKGNQKDMGVRLAKADYHGAKIAVLAACNPSLVGCVGFVVQESKNTFKIIDKTNKISVIPKDGVLFSFAHDGQIYRLNGSQLKLASHQRTKIKFKSKKIGQII
ncbi:ribonuclease P/MRP subunit POP4 [Brevipalpus obovatus]|uniref:ribonuclease P/MRP subunit POP4 n=1 Tax=Brevipalpus obovatus TaxID=246614 RepID=UPI003D9E0BC0